MKIKLTLTVFFSLFILLGCKKDKLKGEKNVLIGSWQWIYTVHHYNLCEGNEVLQILSSPYSGIESLKVEFNEKGFANLYKNNNLEYEKKRIVFKAWEVSTHYTFYNRGYYYFKMKLDNKKDFVLQGEVSNDTLVLYSGFWPDQLNRCGDCCYKWNYFIRN